MNTQLKIPAGTATLDGILTLPEGATIAVLFAHGSGSSRYSPRNGFVASKLNQVGLATLLFDLLTPDEEAEDMQTGRHRFNIHLLAERLVHATQWMRERKPTSHLGIGYFGASTGGGAALVAAAGLPAEVGAVVSRGGRPDLAGEALCRVEAPTLLVVGERDVVVLDLNQKARQKMRCEVRLEIVPGATHLFEERGTLDHVAQLACDWFRQWPTGRPSSERSIR